MSLQSTVIKAFYLSVLALAFFALAQTTEASSASDIQPASDVVYGERLQVNSAVSVADSSYFYRGVHLGRTDGTGGVIFANGSIVNVSDGSVPVTFGDDMRIDGRIWRGPSAGPGDGLPVKIYDDLRIDGQVWGGVSKGNTIDGQSVVFADAMRPAEDNKNDFGSNGYRWKNANFAGTVTVGDLGGDNVVSENNLAVTNSPQAGDVLTYSGNNTFLWSASSGGGGTSSSGSGDSDWTGAGTGTMYSANTSDNVGIGISSGLNAKLHVSDTSGIGVIGHTTADTAGVYGSSSNTGSSATGVTGLAAAYGGDFSATATSGIGVRGQGTGTSGVGVRGNATSTTGTNYGGWFESDSATGIGSFSASNMYGSQAYVSPGASSTSSVATLGQNYDGTTAVTTLSSVPGHYGGFFESTHAAGRGVYGVANSLSLGTSFGGYFDSTGNALGTGAYGKGQLYGLNGLATPPAGSIISTGVIGQNEDDDGSTDITIPSGTFGGWFEDTHTLGTGLYGTAAATSTTVYGVHGKATASTSGYGVVGEGTAYGGYFTASNSAGRGVYGYTGGSSAYGVEGINADAGRGVYGASDTGVGVYGETNGTLTSSIGVKGVSNGASGTTYGVYGDATSSSGGIGVKGEGGLVGGQFHTQDTTSGYSGRFYNGNFKVILSSTSNSFYITTGGGGIGLKPGSHHDVQIDSNGALVDATASSIRFKDNVKDLDNKAASLLDLQPVSFIYKSNGEKGIGLIAEEVEKVMPELVTYNEEGEIYGVRYDHLPIYLLQLGQGQQAKIVAYEKKISEQQSEISTLKTELGDLKSTFCKYLPDEDICQ